MSAEILKMIEAVDPSDEGKLAEIDARVWALIRLDGDFKITFNGGSVYYRHNSWPEDARTILHHSFEHEEYTRSRDALKAIRPKGWNVCGHYACATALGYTFSLHEAKAGGKQVIGSGMLKTEELAELHAIIQAIEFERQTL